MKKATASNAETPATPKQAVEATRYVFVLLEEFTLLAFASAIEPLRAANRYLGVTYYDWVLLSGDGAPVTASCGATVAVDGGLDVLRRDDVVLLCGGLNIQNATTQPLLNWLRRESRRGTVMGGLCTASFALAKAGLLDGKRATTHWENIDGFTETFENVDLSGSVFVRDGNRLSAAGGTSSLDLMLSVIARDHGEATASEVADMLIYSSIRTERDTQRLAIPARIGVRHPKLSHVVHIMEQNLEDPVSPAVLAELVGLSTRQLERLFQRYLNRSPKRYYMELRLQKARNLLMQTEMSVINVALACGFSSPSHFSKCYRAHYQTTPYRERGTQSV